MNRPSIFRILLWVICIYHLLLGVAGLVFPPDTLGRIIALVLGVSPDLDDTVLLSARFAGAYVFALGVGAGLLAWKPEHNRCLLPVLLTLFGIRLINRAVVFTTLGETFGVSPLRNGFGLAALAVLFFGLLWSGRRKT